MEYIQDLYDIQINNDDICIANLYNNCNRINCRFTHYGDICPHLLKYGCYNKYCKYKHNVMINIIHPKFLYNTMLGIYENIKSNNLICIKYNSIVNSSYHTNLEYISSIMYYSYGLIIEDLYRNYLEKFRQFIKISDIHKYRYLSRCLYCKMRPSFIINKSKLFLVFTLKSKLPLDTILLINSFYYHHDKKCEYLIRTYSAINNYEFGIRENTSNGYRAIPDHKLGCVEIDDAGEMVIHYKNESISP